MDCFLFSVRPHAAIRRIPVLAVTLLLLWLAVPCLAALADGDPAPAAAAEPAPSLSHQAFETLKSLEGTWVGEGGYSDGGESFPVTHEYRVTAAGHTVMEVQNVGTDHEMVSMYYLEDGHLVMNHYCAGGNQPKMILDVAAVAEGKLDFQFAGGSNLDPATDSHIHGGTFELADDGTLKATWRSWSGGEPAGQMVFTVTRADG